jgi:hypothetical protein
MSIDDLERRVSVLERAVTAATGISLAEFDPEAQAAKREEEARVARAAAEARKAEEARIVAEQQAQAQIAHERQETEAIQVQKLVEERLRHDGAS